MKRKKPSDIPSIEESVDRIADALDRLARAVDRMGMNAESTLPNSAPGCLEALVMEIRNGLTLTVNARIEEDE